YIRSAICLSIVCDLALLPPSTRLPPLPTLFPYTTLFRSPAGSWSGPDRISHAIPYHNLMTDPSWFFPAFLIGRVLSSSNYVAAYVGHETRDSVAVEHLTISQTFATSPQAGALLRHLSQIEIYLDSGTLLPVTLAFNVHPDK